MGKGDVIYQFFFFLSLNVFKMAFTWGRQKSALCSKGLTLYKAISSFNKPGEGTF